METNQFKHTLGRTHMKRSNTQYQHVHRAAKYTLAELQETRSCTEHPNVKITVQTRCLHSLRSARAGRKLYCETDACARRADAPGLLLRTRCFSRCNILI